MNILRNLWFAAIAVVIVAGMGRMAHIVWATWRLGDAFEARDFDEMNRLVRQGAYAGSLWDYYSGSIIHISMENSHYDLVEALIVRRVDINLQSPGGETPLVTAIETRLPPDLIDLLIRKGGKVHPPENPGEPLKSAARRGNVDAMRLLILHGADLEKYGQHAISAARNRGYDDIVELIEQELRQRAAGESAPGKPLTGAAP